MPASKPGIFPGYRLEPGGQWKADFYVADLEDFRNGFTRPSVHQVKRIWRNREERYVFLMLAAYERLTREVQLLDTGVGKGLPKADASSGPDDQPNAIDPGPDPSDEAGSGPTTDLKEIIGFETKNPSLGIDTTLMLDLQEACPRLGRLSCDSFEIL